MSEFGQNLKDFVLKGIETIGSTVGSLASSTRQKVDEFNLENEKKDLFAGIGQKVYELYQQGAEVSDALRDDIMKISEIESKLSLLRSSGKETPDAEEKGGETDSRPSASEEELRREAAPSVNVYTAENDHDIPVLRVEDEESDVPEEDATECPLSSAINDLFEKMPPVTKMVDKVNSSLDELGDSLRRFTGQFDQELNDFSDRMMGKDKPDQDQ